MTVKEQIEEYKFWARFYLAWIGYTIQEYKNRVISHVKKEK
jgi:hypothetical protein